MYKVYRAGVIKISDGQYIDNANHTEWAEYNKWLNQGNIPSPQDPEPEQNRTVDEVRDAKIDHLREKRKRLRGRINTQMGGADNAIWLMIQKAEAESTAGPTPFINKMAEASGLTVAQIKVKIAERFDVRLIRTMGELEGCYLKHKIALRNLTTKQEIRDYDMSTGWPDIPLPRSSDR